MAVDQLFRSLSKGGSGGEATAPEPVPRIYKAMARAGLPPAIMDGLSWHSARIGAPPRTWSPPRIELPAILQDGRWKTTTMVNRYGERLPAASAAPRSSRGYSIESRCQYRTRILEHAEC